MHRARALVFATVLALVAAPSVVDACVFSCQAAASFATRLGAQPCHHHQGHHPTVGDQHTALVHDHDAASQATDVSTQAVEIAASVHSSGLRVAAAAAAPAASPPVSAHLPLRI